MSLDKMFPNISSRLRKRQNDKFMEANPNLFLPIKQLSRRVQLQKNFDNFNHSCNYLKNVIRIGTRSQIPSVIIALMEHVSNLLKLCSTWSNLIKDPENQVEQYRSDVLINLTELVRTLDYFEETGENNSQATHVLYKVCFLETNASNKLISATRMSNRLVSIIDLSDKLILVTRVLRCELNSVTPVAPRGGTYH